MASFDVWRSIGGGGGGDGHASGSVRLPGVFVCPLAGAADKRAGRSSLFSWPPPPPLARLERTSQLNSLSNRNDYRAI